MPTGRLFKAFDLQREKPHTIPLPPKKIHQHRVDKREWAAATKPSSKKVPKRRAARQARRRISTVADILRDVSGENVCMYCGLPGDDANCGIKCYRAFLRENIQHDLIDIKGPGPLGYGAYTKPGISVKKGQWLGEYVGDLHPLEYDTGSMYCFTIPGKCVLDAGEAGNWTRFINSHCKPNLQCWPDFLGKRAVILFKAKMDIGPEEELTFKYGKQYFRQAGFECRCSSCVPVVEKKKKRK